MEGEGVDGSLGERKDRRLWPVCKIKEKMLIYIYIYIPNKNIIVLLLLEFF